MSNETAINTRVELLSEAIETYVKACCAGYGQTLKGDDARRQFDLQQLSRRELGNAIRVCLTPTLRVVSSNDTLASKEVVPYGGKGIDGMNLA